MLDQSARIVIINFGTSGVRSSLALGGSKMFGECMQTRGSGGMLPQETFGVLGV